MSRNRRSLLRRRHGMTLMEIMAVLVILSTIMTIVTVAVVDRMQEANVDSTKLQINKISNELQMYALKNKGKYPTTSEGLEAARKYFSDGVVPVDAWGNEFQYFSPGTHGDHDFEIISLGRDGKEGGEDIDADIKSWELKD